MVVTERPTLRCKLTEVFNELFENREERLVVLGDLSDKKSATNSESKERSCCFGKIGAISPFASDAGDAASKSRVLGQSIIGLFESEESDAEDTVLKQSRSSRYVRLPSSPFSPSFAKSFLLVGMISSTLGTIQDISRRNIPFQIVSLLYFRLPTSGSFQTILFRSCMIRNHRAFLAIFMCIFLLTILGVSINTSSKICLFSNTYSSNVSLTIRTIQPCGQIYDPVIL